MYVYAILIANRLLTFCIIKKKKRSKKQYFQKEIKFKFKKIHRILKNVIKQNNKALMRTWPIYYLSFVVRFDSFLGDLQPIRSSAMKKEFNIPMSWKGCESEVIFNCQKDVFIMVGKCRYCHKSALCRN